MRSDTCTICGKEILAGQDLVLYLEKSINSYHHGQHLACRLKQERVECAKLAYNYGGSAAEEIADLILERSKL